MSARVSVGLYGEIDMNLVDGSSVWLQSLALVLVAIPDVDLTVLLRTPERRRILTDPLYAEARCEVVDPIELGADVRRLEPSQALDLLERLDDRRRFDVVVLRGAGIADEAVGRGTFDGRMWLYHVPVHGASAEEERDVLRARARAASRILYQTEAIRAHVEQAAPEAAGKLLHLPPMIPAPLPVDEPAPVDKGPLRRLFYAGKFSPEYFFLEMIELFARLRERIPGLEFHVAGDKVHNPPADPSFKPAAEAALTGTDGLIWHGAMPRAEVGRLLREADVALSLRHPSMDASAELSTKILEYGASGCAVVLNRNPIHVRLLGDDYPLLADGVDDALARLLAVSNDPALRESARHACREASLEFTFDKVAARLAPHLRAVRTAAGGHRVVIAGHDFKFLEAIRHHMARRGAEIREELWTRHNVHDEAEGRAAIEWSDIVFCEWCLGNAIYYSRSKRSGQRLVVRMHRMELETEYPNEVELESVDALVFVARHVLEAACERFGWPVDDDRLHVVPNSIDIERLCRPKLSGAETTLGMIGAVPSLKRLDRALDILERVRAHDERFRLVVKGRGPWEYAWMLARPHEREHYERVYRRIERSPLLGSAVAFEPFGDDVADYLQKIGYILSVSDLEGHPVGVAEAMASGSAPVVIDRPGAELQVPAGAVHKTTEEAAAAILSTTYGEGYAVVGERSRAFASQWSWEKLAPVWDEILGFSPLR